MSERSRPAWRHRWSQRRSDDRGFFAIWTVILTVAVWGLIGLLVDAGNVLRERSDAFGAAAAAGRAGAQAIDEDAVLQTGELRLDEFEAERRAREYLRDRGFTGVVVANGLDVQVTVNLVVDLQMLPGGSVEYDIDATVRAVQSGGPVPIAGGGGG